MDSMSIDDAWQRFEGRLVPLIASPEQRADMRMAFYAGAITLLEFTQAIAGLSDDLAGVAVLERLHTEKRAFVREMEAKAKERQ